MTSTKRRLRIDLETYSEVPIEAGVYAYSEHPSFRILMACYHYDDEPTRAIFDQDEIRETLLPYLWDDETTKVAHNAQFDRVCLSRIWRKDRFLPPAQWHDTMAVAGVRGYPQKLEHLARALGVSPKDTAGKRLINLFSKPRNGRRNLPEAFPDDWMDFISYGLQDVDTLREVDVALGDFPTPGERAIWLADQIINDRGIRADVELARAAEKAATSNQEQQMEEIRDLTGIANPGSGPQMLAWFEETGYPLPNLQKETVSKALEGNLPPVHRRVLELRQHLALVASKKFSAALDGVSEDGRIRGQFRYFGAHTGRWTGRGVQLQNLPRASFFNDKQRYGETREQYWTRAETPSNAAIVDTMLGDASAEDLKKLVRPLFMGPFVVVDYAAIEARVVAWLAGEEWALEAFRAGRDIYEETAQRLGGLTRAQGKVAVLALGYNGGVNSLKALGGASTYFDPRTGKRIQSERLQEAIDSGLADTRPMTDEEYRELVHAWRRANRKIVGLWQLVDDAFYRGGAAGSILRVEGEGQERRLVLPSGRAICYHGVKFQFDGLGRRRATFASPQGYRADTYGGRLVENATQAVARDVLGEALVRLENAGCRVVGHVHDEILVETDSYPGPVDTIMDVMNEVPAWASGLPIAGEGFACKRYRKG